MSKNISKVKTILFDGSDARFSLSVEGHFMKTKPDGSTSNLVYVSDNGTVNVNPSVYLVFAYKGDTFEESKAIFTSFPQIHKLRYCTNMIRQYLMTPEAFMNVNNAEVVNPEYAEPLNVTNIGQAMNWLSFSLTVIGNADGTTGRGVKIRYSGTDFASVLTEDEFFTISEIINELNLSSYKFMMSSMVLLNNNDVGKSVAAYGNNQFNNNNTGYTTRQAQNYSQPPMQTAPRYQSAPRRSYSQNVPTQSVPVMNSVPAQNATNTQAPAPRQSSAPSRETIVNMAAVDNEAPTFQMSFPSDDEIANIFGVGMDE